MSNQAHEIFLPNAVATEALGAHLGAHLAAGDVLCLKGDLGAGKTAFARGVIRARAQDQALEVPSPTFTLVQTYEVGEAGEAPLWHFDLYRLEDPQEIWELGFEEALDDICLIEWPEKGGSLIPEGALWLELKVEGEGRQARFLGPEAWIEGFSNDG